MKSTRLFFIAAALLAASVACAGTPRAVTPDELKKIEAALPAAAPAKPDKPRKLLVFDRTEGFVHDCIPVCNKAIELLGTKTGAYTVTISNDMGVFTPENLAQYDAVLFNNTTGLKFSDANQRRPCWNTSVAARASSASTRPPIISPPGPRPGR